MPLKIYNTLTCKKEELIPVYPGEARLYVCGVTVYDLAHIGHARSALVFDVIRRYLRFKGYRVRFVKNFTDVDDKIIKRAHEEGVAPRELAERYVEEYRKDMAALGVEPADVEPKATEHISQMVRLIERLLAKGFAYRVDGDIYFEVRRFRGYGQLSGKNLEDLRAGARVEVDERKRDPLDFALWKSSKAGEPAWESPWGPGRPGWHIECSAMSMHYLGESFDIHGGGEDLIFPTTRMRLLSPRPRPTNRSCGAGSTTASLGWARRRCPSLGGTSSPSRSYSVVTIQRPSGSTCSAPSTGTRSNLPRSMSRRPLGT